MDGNPFGFLVLYGVSAVPIFITIAGAAIDLHDGESLSTAHRRMRRAAGSAMRTSIVQRMFHRRAAVSRCSRHPAFGAMKRARYGLAPRRLRTTLAPLPRRRHPAVTCQHTYVNGAPPMIGRHPHGYVEDPRTTSVPRRSRPQPTFGSISPSIPCAGRDRGRPSSPPPVAPDLPSIRARAVASPVPGPDFESDPDPIVAVSRRILAWSAASTLRARPEVLAIHGHPARHVRRG